MIETPFAITPALDILLRGSDQMPIGLHHLQVATAEQLCRLHYSMGSIKAVKAKLRKLVDNGYVQIDAIPTKFTRSPYYYALDKLGVQYLQKAGMDINESFRSEKEVDKHSLFMEHTLELNDIVIAAALLKRSTPNHWLDSFIHERVLKRSPYKAIWQGGSFSLIPDTFLDFRVRMPDGLRRVPVVVEHDRGTEEQHYFRRRIRAYIVFLQNEGFKKMFQTKSITIAFTTSAGVSRLGRMREWTWHELSQESKEIGLTFCFTILEKPIDPLKLWVEPRWYTPYEDKPVSLLRGV
jgi:Replication-relaxation